MKMLSEKLARLAAKDKHTRKVTAMALSSMSLDDLPFQSTISRDSLREEDYIEQQAQPMNPAPVRARKSNRGYVLGQGHKYRLGDSNPVDYI